MSFFSRKQKSVDSQNLSGILTIATGAESMVEADTLKSLRLPNSEVYSQLRPEQVTQLGQKLHQSSQSALEKGDNQLATSLFITAQAVLKKACEQDPIKGNEALKQLQAPYLSDNARNGVDASAFTISELTYNRINTMVNPSHSQQLGTPVLRKMPTLQPGS